MSECVEERGFASGPVDGCHQAVMVMWRGKGELAVCDGYAKRLQAHNILYMYI